MDYTAEQAEEIEVITSIYPDEIKVRSPTHYAVKINLDTPSDRSHTIALMVRYPPTYPEVIPDIDVGYASNILYEMKGENDSEDEESSEDENDDDDEDDEETKEAKKALLLAENIDFSHDDFSVLRSKLLEEAEVSVGMPMVFTLVSQLKQEAEDLFESILAKKQKEYDAKVAQREQEEQKKFQGTPVTRELYNEWRARFRKEMQLDEYFERRSKEMHKGKMLGREIFEKGLDEHSELE